MSRVKTKLFFFRLEPAQLLSALIRIPEAERGAWITRIAIELEAGTPVDPFSVSLFAEAKESQRTVSERNSINSKISAEKRRLAKKGRTTVNDR